MKRIKIVGILLLIVVTIAFCVLFVKSKTTGETLMNVLLNNKSAVGGKQTVEIVKTNEKEDLVENTTLTEPEQKEENLAPVPEITPTPRQRVDDIMAMHTQKKVVDYGVISGKVWDNPELFVLVCNDANGVLQSGIDDIEGSDIAFETVEGWYVKGTEVQRVFANNILEDGTKFIHEDLIAGETGISHIVHLNDGMAVVPVIWSCSGYNSQCVFFEVENGNVKYTFSAPDVYTTEDEKILSMFFYNGVEEQYTMYGEYNYTDSGLELVKTWNEYW